MLQAVVVAETALHQPQSPLQVNTEAADVEGAGSSSRTSTGTESTGSGRSSNTLLGLSRYTERQNRPHTSLAWVPNISCSYKEGLLYQDRL